MKFLVVNAYGAGDSNPGRKRSGFWIDLLKSQGHSTHLLYEESILNVSKYRRLKALMFSKIPSSEFDTDAVMSSISQALMTKSFDYIILCVPSYQLCQLIPRLISEIRIIVDIRDGIKYESFYFPLEIKRFSKYLSELEESLDLATLVTTNIPGLKDYYAKITKKTVYLLWPFPDNYHLEFRGKTNQDNRILFFGGLVKSSRGQNVHTLIRFLRYSTNHKLELIGRFNFLEKLRFKISKNVSFHNEVSPSNASSLLVNYNVLLIMANCTRDLLPAKFWLYLRSNITILIIGESQNLDRFVSDKHGIFMIPDELEAITAFFHDFKPGFYDRSDLDVFDDRIPLFSEIR